MTHDRFDDFDTAIRLTESTARRAVNELTLLQEHLERLGLAALAEKITKSLSEMRGVQRGLALVDTSPVVDHGVDRQNLELVIAEGRIAHRERGKL